MDQNFDNEADKHAVPVTWIICPGPPTNPQFSLTLKQNSKFKNFQTNQDIVFHFAIFYIKYSTVHYIYIPKVKSKSPVFWLWNSFDDNKSMAKTIAMCDCLTGEKRSNNRYHSLHGRLKGWISPNALLI